MESPRKFFPAVVLLLLLVATAGMAPVQARECEKDSDKFVGLCMKVDNCQNVCRGEGFTSARCSTFRRRCVCIKEC
nr:defensin Tk-AMP-D1.1-like [Setaria viridis]